MSYANSKTSQKAEKRDAPVDEVRFGSIVITTWRNSNSKGDTFYNFVPKRIYREGDEWKETHSLGVRDLLPLAQAAEEAFRRATSPAE